MIESIRRYILILCAAAGYPRPAWLKYFAGILCGEWHGKFGAHSWVVDNGVRTTHLRGSDRVSVEAVQLRLARCVRRRDR
jgi:hypothetical protein